MRSRDTSEYVQYRYCIIEADGGLATHDTHLTAHQHLVTIDISPWLHVLSRSCLLSAATLITGINNQICRAVITIYCVVACVRSGAIVISIGGPGPERMKTSRSTMPLRDWFCFNKIRSAVTAMLPLLWPRAGGC